MLESLTSGQTRRPVFNLGARSGKVHEPGPEAQRHYMSAALPTRLSAPAKCPNKLKTFFLVIAHVIENIKGKVPFYNFANIMGTLLECFLYVLK